MAQATVSRKATAERWQSALNRAIVEALDVLIEPISGEAYVESSSRPGTLYQVSRETCTCAAAVAGDPVCKHRACYLAQIGELAIEAPAADCPDCCGCGEQWFPSGGRKCQACRGTGRIAPAAPPIMIPIRTRPSVAA